MRFATVFLWTESGSRRVSCSLNPYAVSSAKSSGPGIMWRRALRYTMSARVVEKCTARTPAKRPTPSGRARTARRRIAHTVDMVQLIAAAQSLWINYNLHWNATQRPGINITPLTTPAPGKTMPSPLPTSTIKMRHGRQAVPGRAAMPKRMGERDSTRVRGPACSRWRWRRRGAGWERKGLAG